MVCKRYITGIICCLLCIFLMSHNANAVDFTYNLNDYDLVYNSNFPTQYCYYSLNSPSSTAGQCQLNPNTGTTFYGLVSESLSHKKQDLVEFYLGASSGISLNSGGNFGFYLYNIGTAVNDWRIINFEEVTDSHFDLVSGYENIQCSQSSNGYVCGSNFVNDDILQYSKIYKVSAIAVANGNGPIGVISSSISMGVCLTENDSCRIRMFGIRRWEFKGSEENKEQAEATQNAVDDAADSSADAKTDSETATSSLLSVITGFFGAMANLNPTNCKFDSHLPFLSGNGEIDLCTVPAPAVVQTVGSLILIGLMVPFAIHMYNRFVTITGSFQK